MQTEILRQHLQAALAALDNDGEETDAPETPDDLFEVLARHRGNVSEDDEGEGEGLKPPRKAHVRLNFKQARQAHHMIAAGLKNRDIARRFGVSSGLISQIRCGKAWNHAKPKEMAS